VPDRLPLAFPVSIRTEDDTQGGNRFAGARFAAPLAEPDPVARIQEIRAFVRSVRAEPALGFLDVLAPAMAVLPTTAVTELSSTLTATTDIQASNIPGLTERVYLAGAQVAGMYPMGPRPGIAAMVTMLTYAGTGCVGLTLEPGTVRDRERFDRCLREGFEEVLALADGAPAGR
jgi:diacylglycerol O-acyltransferase / wax synthase